MPDHHDGNGYTKLPPGAEDYSAGLQVHETAGQLEVVTPSTLPEAVPAAYQYQYAEMYNNNNKFSDPHSHSPSPSPSPAPHVQPATGNYAHHYAAGSRSRICGLQRMVFCAVLAVVVFLVVAAVAVGLGVGLGTRDDGGGTSTLSSSSASSATAATATATATAGTDDIICPSANRTLYSLSDSAKEFLVLCGRDYSSSDGAMDLKQVNTTTFADCLEECGGTDGCIGAGWGQQYGSTTCWLKSLLGEPNWSSNWYFAIEDDGS